MSSTSFRSRAFTRARKGIAVFIRIRVGSLKRAYGSPVTFGFAWADSDAH